jgi:hypothetical protein
MRVPRRTVERAFRQAAQRSFLIDLKAAAWGIALFVVLGAAAGYLFAAPTRMVGETTGVVVGVHQPASKIGRSNFRASVQLNDGRVVPVIFRGGVVPRRGSDVVIQIQQRRWPPYTYVYSAQTAP